jgi:hypothetical protein
VCSFSVWKVTNGISEICSHGTVGENRLRARGWQNVSVWYDATTVLTADSNGSIAMTVQDVQNVQNVQDVSSVR